MKRSCASQKVEGLKDKSDLFVAYAREFVVVHLGDVLAVYPVFAFGWSIQTADQIHQG